MKRYIATLVLGIVFVSPKMASAASCCAATAPPTTNALPTDSIYQLDSTWRDSDGRALALSDLRGTRRIVAMFYSSCAFACPMLILKLKKIEAQLPPDSDVVFTLFSFDSEHDQPATLRDFMARQQIGAPRWQAFTAPPDAVRELAAVLGIRYRQTPDGSFAHSNEITLLDPEGRILAQLPDLNQDPAPLLNALR